MRAACSGSRRCFGFAALTWRISPLHVIGVTAIILIVLRHRDFRARTPSATAR